MSKIIQIEQMDEGYLVKDTEQMKNYAVSKEKLIQKVKALLGITDTKPAPKPKPPTPARHSEMSDTLFKKDKPESPIKECEAFEIDPITERRVGLTYYWIKDDKICISREGYGVRIYFELEALLELSKDPMRDETIKVFGKATYANKAVILNGFFKDAPPISSLIASFNNKSNENEQGSCDDVDFEDCTNNSPENCKFCTNKSRFQSKKKINAQKPSPPLMKATFNP